MTGKKIANKTTVKNKKSSTSSKVTSSKVKSSKVKSSKVKSKNKKNNNEPNEDSGIVIVEDDIVIDQDKVNEERRAYLEEARSQEASD